MDEPKAADLPAAVENLESENQLLQIKNVGKKMGLMKAKTAQHAELNGDPFSV